MKMRNLDGARIAAGLVNGIAGTALADRMEVFISNKAGHSGIADQVDGPRAIRTTTCSRVSSGVQLVPFAAAGLRVSKAMRPPGAKCRRRLPRTARISVIAQEHLEARARS